MDQTRTHWPFLREAPWISLFPGVFLAAAVLSLNLVGDALRDALDPRGRNNFV